MPKYLVEVRSTHNGLEGVLAKGGSTRAEAATTVVESVGGKVEALDFGFGQTDADVLVDLPDNSAAAAVALTVGASGGATLRTVALLTPEEVDRATKASVEYRPPGAWRLTPRRPGEPAHPAPTLASPRAAAEGPASRALPSRRLGTRRAGQR